jgi:hypothetical protein
VRADRLLATDEDGNGAHYSFVGWVSRSYRTWACAVARGDSEIVLILPEWHPGHPVRVAERMMPTEAIAPGGWMLAAADLSAPIPARLALTLTGPCDDPGRLVCHAPVWRKDGS